jgi:catechol 2,3-dioxygenase-like lactoylglutathione lyase family enzyme
MRIGTVSVLVDDQEKARRFYTEKLGFLVKHDFDVGGALWLTVVSPEDPSGTEILLEPDWNPDVPAKEWKASLYGKGMPVIVLNVDDVHAEYERLRALGVAFQSEPLVQGEFLMATLDDTCGNFVMITSPSKS